MNINPDNSLPPQAPQSTPTTVAPRPKQVVSQKLMGGKVDSPNLAFSSSDVYSCSV